LASAGDAAMRIEKSCHPVVHSRIVTPTDHRPPYLHGDLGMKSRLGISSPSASVRELRFRGGVSPADTHARRGEVEPKVISSP
jgi:hypothetical protein